MNQGPATPQPRLVIPARPSTTAPSAQGAVTTNGTTPRPVPRPGPRPGQFSRKFPPPDLGPDRHPDAVYVLDTGVGTAFAHVDRLDLLVDHYQDQLRYVDAVQLEWRRHATMRVTPLEPGHSAEDKAAHDQVVHLKAAGSLLDRRATDLFGEPITTSEDDLGAIEDLITDLCAFPPAKPKAGDDRGECASVHAGMALASAPDQPVVVLCANDNRARQLAGARGLGHRNMHTVLREMVREDRLPATDAYALYQQMSQVTQLPWIKRPAAAAAFT